MYCASRSERGKAEHATQVGPGLRPNESWLPRHSPKGDGGPGSPTYPLVRANLAAFVYLLDRRRQDIYVATDTNGARTTGSGGVRSFAYELPMRACG